MNYFKKPSFLTLSFSHTLILSYSHSLILMAKQNMYQWTLTFTSTQEDDYGHISLNHTMVTMAPDAKTARSQFKKAWIGMPLRKVSELPDFRDPIYSDTSNIDALDDLVREEDAKRPLVITASVKKDASASDDTIEEQEFKSVTEMLGKVWIQRHFAHVFHMCQ